MFNIVLYQPKIPPNTGNIARLCVGAGCTLHIIRPIPFFLDDKTMRRAGCDYWPHLKLKVHDSLEDLTKGICGPRVFYITKHGEKIYTEVKYCKEDYLVFGSEDTGLTPELLEVNREKTIHIPMYGPVRSINLSNAVSIVVYEALRQITSSALDH